MACPLNRHVGLDGRQLASTLSPMIFVFYFCVFLAPSSAILTIQQPPRVNITNIIQAFRYTLDHLFCVQVISDGSDFGNNIVKGVHHASKSLVYSFDNICSGFYVVAGNFVRLESLLTKLQRRAKHRILCMLPILPGTDFENFIDEHVNLFKDSEIFIGISDSPIGYKLSHTCRRFTPTLFNGKKWLPEKVGVKVNFNKREVKVGTFNCSTFSEIHYPYTAGSEMEIFLEIANRLNLSYKFLVPDEATRFPLGKFVNGTWRGGLLGLLATDKADLGFCGLWIAHNKMESAGIEMSVPLKKICLKYLVPRPSPLEGEWYGIFSPYSIQVWMSVFLVYLIISVVLPMTAYLDSLISSSESCRYITFENSWLLVVGILMQGSWTSSAHNQGPSRHLISWLTVFSLLIGSMFAGSLASYLTRPKFTTKPDCVEDLVKYGYHWTATRQPIVDTLFNLNDPIYEEWTKRIRVVSSDKELQEALKEKGQVIFGYQMYGVFSLLDEDIPDEILQGYEAISGCASEFYLGFAFRVGSPYLQFFNGQLQNMQETGLVHRAMKVSTESWMKRRKYMIQVLQLSQDNYYRTNVLTLASLKGIFWFWSSGLFVSLLVFLYELVSNPLREYFS